MNNKIKLLKNKKFSTKLYTIYNILYNNKYKIGFIDNKNLIFNINFLLIKLLIKYGTKIKIKFINYLILII